MANVYIPIDRWALRMIVLVFGWVPGVARFFFDLDTEASRQARSSPHRLTIGMSIIIWGFAAQLIGTVCTG